MHLSTFIYKNTNNVSIVALFYHTSNILAEVSGRTARRAAKMDSCSFMLESDLQQRIVLCINCKL